MNIQCTVKLMARINDIPVAPADPNPLYSWHANLYLVRRRNVVMFVHDFSRYALILNGLVGSDFQCLPELFRLALTEALLAEGVMQVTIDRYLDLAGPVRYAPTGNKSVAGTMNQIGQLMQYHADAFDGSRMMQTAMALRFSKYINKIDKNYYTPRELLLPALASLGEGGSAAWSPVDKVEKPAKTEKAFVLRVELPCGKKPIWRLVAVPVRITFSRLHRILQACFCWQDYHLREFQMLADSGEIVAKSAMDLMDSDMWLVDPDIERFSERKRLTAWLPQCRSFRYLYDFGDGWDHSIELEQVVDSYEGFLPACLDGEGTAPPEDVGGEGGYLEFLGIVNRKRDTQEKREMLVWAHSLDWRPFDLQEINERLRSRR